MRELPIIFNVEMVQAILDGRKTQIRKAVNAKQKEIPRTFTNEYNEVCCSECGMLIIPQMHICTNCTLKNAPYKVGDHLYVRETFYEMPDIDNDGIFNEGLNQDDFYCDNGESINDTFEWWEKLWNSTAKDGYKWRDNPWVFVYEFKHIDKTGSAI